MLSVLGITAGVLPAHALAQTWSSSNSDEVRKLNREGKPGGEKEVIMPVVIHNSVLPVAGQGAHDTRDAKEWTIESRTKMVIDEIRMLVEIGGGTMDSALHASVNLAKIEDWGGLPKFFASCFPHGGPARTTVAVADLPGNSLVEIDCIAAVPRK